MTPFLKSIFTFLMTEIGYSLRCTVILVNIQMFIEYIPIFVICIRLILDHIWLLFEGIRALIEYVRLCIEGKCSVYTKDKTFCI